MPTTNALHSVDCAIIGFYLLFVIGLGLWIGRKHKEAEDYFLAGRSMTWLFVGVSLFASNISSTTLIGLAGDAYSTGISVFNYEWTASVVLVFFAVFLLPFLLRAQVYTLPEYLGLRFGPFARKYFSALSLFLNILVYPTLMFDLLPAGLLGLCLAGFIAALMSQIDSTLNAASTLVTMDFIRPAKPALSQRQLMRIGRIVTAVFMILAAWWAPQIEKFASLFRYLQQVLSYTVPPIVVLYLAGIFSRRANRTGAYAALAAGTAAGVILFVCNAVLEVWSIHFLYVAPIGCAVSAIALGLGSRFGAPPAAEQLEACWTRTFFRRETQDLKQSPWYRNYRVWAVVLLALTAWLVIAFR